MVLATEYITLLLAGWLAEIALWMEAVVAARSLHSVVAELDGVPDWSLEGTVQFCSFYTYPKS